MATNYTRNQEIKVINITFKELATQLLSKSESFRLYFSASLVCYMVCFVCFNIYIFYVIMFTCRKHQTRKISAKLIFGSVSTFEKWCMWSSDDRNIVKCRTRIFTLSWPEMYIIQWLERERDREPEKNKDRERERQKDRERERKNILKRSKLDFQLK